MSKLQPSPDWFVGLDSIDLCGSGGHFVDTLTVEADPLDAGTDNGFTFTSPNWPTGVLTNAIYLFIRGVRKRGPRPPYTHTIFGTTTRQKGLQIILPTNACLRLICFYFRAER